MQFTASSALITVRGSPLPAQVTAAFLGGSGYRVGFPLTYLTARPGRLSPAGASRPYLPLGPADARPELTPEMAERVRRYFGRDLANPHSSSTGCSGGGDPRPRVPWVGLGDHGAELEDAEGAALKAHAGLAVEDGAAGVEADGEGE